jgi:hypothetical protein
MPEKKTPAPKPGAPAPGPAPSAGKQVSLPAADVAKHMPLVIAILVLIAIALQVLGLVRRPRPVDPPGLEVVRAEVADLKAIVLAPKTASKENADLAAAVQKLQGSVDTTTGRLTVFDAKVADAKEAAGKAEAAATTAATTAATAANGAKDAAKTVEGVSAANKAITEDAKATAGQAQKTAADAKKAVADTAAAVIKIEKIANDASAAATRVEKAIGEANAAVGSAQKAATDLTAAGTKFPPVRTLTDLVASTTKVGEDVASYGQRQKLLNEDVQQLQQTVRGLADQMKRESQAVDQAVVVSHSAEADGDVSLLAVKTALKDSAWRATYPRFRVGVWVESNGDAMAKLKFPTAEKTAPVWSDDALPDRKLYSSKPASLVPRNIFPDPPNARRRCLFVVSPRCPPPPDPDAPAWKGITVDVLLLGPVSEENSTIRAATDAWSQFARRHNGVATSVYFPPESAKAITSDVVTSYLPAVIRRLLLPE